MELSDVELRVLGVLIEKSMTQPSSYPLTLNAITLGANQLQNRDPVVQYSDSDVSAAIRTLTHKKLIEQAPPSPGARANRFRHCAAELFRWDRRQQAVMAELMLRGRQTAGELRSRASRMMSFPDVESVSVTLRELMGMQPAYVEELPREPGRSANRFRHRLSADAGAEAAASAAVVHPAEAGAPAEVAAGPSLAERMSLLEQRVDELAAGLRRIAEARGIGFDAGAADEVR